jgi:hypothetical protein
MIQSCPPTPPSSSGPGRGPLKAQTAVRVRLGASDSKKPPTDDVERFLSMVRFENKGKLEELPDLNLNLK